MPALVPAGAEEEARADEDGNVAIDQAMVDQDGDSDGDSDESDDSDDGGPPVDACAVGALVCDAANLGRIFAALQEDAGKCGFPFARPKACCLASNSLPSSSVC